MSYLQPFVRQVKPRTESYTPPVDKVQSFLTEGSTTEATLMENVIVACWNNRKLKKMVENLRCTQKLNSYLLNKR